MLGYERPDKPVSQSALGLMPTQPHLTKRETEAELFGSSLQIGVGKPKGMGYLG